MDDNLFDKQWQAPVSLSTHRFLTTTTHHQDGTGGGDATVNAVVVAAGVAGVKELCLTGCVNFFQIVPNILAAYNVSLYIGVIHKSIYRRTHQTTYTTTPNKKKNQNTHNKHNKHNSSGEETTFSLTAAQAGHPLVLSAVCGYVKSVFMIQLVVLVVYLPVPTTL